jgi:excisionase family DNA binding protein
VTTLHIFTTNAFDADEPSGVLGRSRLRAAGLAHLQVMDATTRRDDRAAGPRFDLIEQVLSLSQLCEHLQVSAQTIYDLRSQGRGPRGFRVGRELRFRISEVDAWLERMERDDERRHGPRRL